MQVVFLRKFSKDIDAIDNPHVRKSLAEFIAEVESLSSLKNYPNIKKLAGHKNAFRFRIGDYRIGIFITGNSVEFARVLHRKDIYKAFP